MIHSLHQYLQHSWPDFNVFIGSHVLGLAAQGRLRQAYDTKLGTVADHNRRLEIYKGAALTEVDLNRIRSFEREIERLKTERDIIRAAMDFLGIAP